MTDLQYKMLEIFNYFNYFSGQDLSIPIDTLTKKDILGATFINIPQDEINSQFLVLEANGLVTRNGLDFFKITQAGAIAYKVEENRRKAIERLSDLQAEQIKTSIKSNQSVIITNRFIWFSGIITLLVTIASLITSIMVYNDKDDEIHQIQSKGLEQELRELRMSIQYKTKMQDTIQKPYHKKPTSK